MDERRKRQLAIRNMCFIAHVDHGKTTLSDSLLSRAELLNANKAGAARSLDTDQQERERGITINATGISLRFDDLLIYGQPMMVNLIDCPGHVDFSGEVTAALRLSDGAMVIVDPFDAKDGRLCVQTETVLRQALMERVRPVLFLNKLDKAFLGMKLSGEEAYDLFHATIELVNDLIRQHQPEGHDFTVSMEASTVLFGSALMGWGFYLDQLAVAMVAKAAKGSTVTIEKITRKLAQREYFARKIYEPLNALFVASLEHTTDTMIELMAKLPVKISTKEKETLSGKDLLKVVLQSWLPVASSVLSVVKAHLPDPVEAQAYRAVPLYEGPPDDQYALAMQRCDPEGPVMAYVAKLVPSRASKKVLIAYGRVFSGTVRPGDSVYILGPEYEPSKDTDRTKAKITAIKILMADSTTNVESAVAGEIVGFVGLSGAMTKSATLTDTAISDAHRMKLMKFQVQPIVRQAVEPKNPSDAPKVAEALKAVSQTDPTCLYDVDEATGQMILAGAGELHLEVRLEDVRRISGVEVRGLPPIVQYHETIDGESGTCMGRSTNKHNRFFVEACPLEPELAHALLSEEITMKMPANERGEVLASRFNWNRDHAKKIVAIEGANVLLDMATGIDLSPVMDNLIIGFRDVCRHASLTSEPLYGVCFTITDAKIHSDGVHRRADQIVPAAKRLFKGALLRSTPVLLEPYFHVSIQVDAMYLKAVTSTLRRRRGLIVADVIEPGSSLHTVEAHLPVADAFGFTDDLRGETSGRAFAMTVFSHWDTVPLANLEALVNNIRKRKGLCDTLPVAEDFLVKA